MINHLFLFQIFWLLNLVCSIIQDIRPPVKMLVPIWKALCAATAGSEGILGTPTTADAPDGVDGEQRT